MSNGPQGDGVSQGLCRSKGAEEEESLGVTGDSGGLGRGPRRFKESQETGGEALCRWTEC